MAYCSRSVPKLNLSLDANQEGLGTMPKKRKKNPGVGIDFKRAKLKVWKKLPQAKNATDTNFKAQSISLPGQSAFTDDRSGIPVTDRNLTIKVRLPTSHFAQFCSFPSCTVMVTKA